MDQLKGFCFSFSVTSNSSFMEEPYSLKLLHRTMNKLYVQMKTNNP
jgi:hypothetical protein